MTIIGVTGTKGKTTVAETACSVLTGDLSRTVMNRIVNRKQLLGEE